MAKDRVLVDTCIVIEAFRVNCWKALSARFELETVGKCVEEACTGDPLDPSRIPVDRKALMEGLAKVHIVGNLERAALFLGNPDLPALDEGERDLLAWLYANQPVPVNLLIATSDRAALRAVHKLWWMDRVHSLEVLGRSAGMDKKQIGKLKAHFHQEWLVAVRLQFHQGVL